MNSPLQRRTHALLQAILLVILACGIWFAGGKSQEHFNKHQTFFTLPPLVHFDHEVINLATLGNYGLYEDFIDIWLLQLLTDYRTYQQSPDMFYEIIRASLSQKPRIESLYLMSCIVFMNMKQPQYCERIGEIGITALPKAWRIPLTLGFVNGIVLKDYAKGAYYYDYASKLPNSPTFLKSLADKLYARNPLRPEEAHSTLNSIISGNDFNSRFKEFLQKQGAAKNHGQQVP